MFRKIRKESRALAQADAEKILARGSHGVLSVIDDEGFPYGVPLSYTFDGTHLWFHCAVEGHKVDALRANPRASFCVIERDDVIPEKYTTNFASAIAFGTIHILEGEDVRPGLRLLCEKYSACMPTDGAEQKITAAIGRCLVLRMDVEYLTGKARTH